MLEVTVNTTAKLPNTNSNRDGNLCNMALSLAINEFKEKLVQEEDQRKLEIDALRKQAHSLQTQCNVKQVEFAALTAVLRKKKRILCFMCPDGSESTVRRVVTSTHFYKRLKMFGEALTHAGMSESTHVTRRKIQTLTQDWTSGSAQPWRSNNHTPNDISKGTSREDDTEEECYVSGERTREQRNQYGFANAIVVE
jgi:hypothetical protein